jgi:tRNA threonylcarbamoyladenosine biosynthesis protein TsaB
VIILALRTDKPESEVYLYQDNREIDSIKWQAHRALAATIQLKIDELLEKNSIVKKDINGLAIFKGPGSFTGLRIGFSVANALANIYNLPIVSANGNTWLDDSIKALLGEQNERVALPEYGAPAATTPPKK